MANLHSTQKIIHYIPSNKDTKGSESQGPKVHLRVAAYARVSTGSDAQQTSFQNQVEYYSHFIKTHRNWHFVKVYSDEGLSGLSTKQRKGFNQMLSDAERGKIDLIVTKSISRFARNMLDAISTIRSLKSQGVDVYFERENLHTMDAKSEFLLSVLSSMAQEESRSISENITWGIRKNMAKGQVVFHYKNFLGYEKGPIGKPRIVKSEAKIVRRIYRDFLNGSSIRQIARSLEKDGIPSPGAKIQWPPSTISSILRNEKYKGDALLQKFYTVDFLTHTLVKNTGEQPQYYIENNHPAIISPETFARVQQELKFRSGAYNRRKIKAYHHNNSSKTTKLC